MSMIDAFLDDLSRTPDDWSLRGVFADWCEDNRQADTAACLRWMVAHHKRPYHGSSGRGTWFNADTIAPDLGDPESDIPGPLFDQLPGGKPVANHKAYPSFREAEVAFHQAWREARERGWNPEV